MFPFYWKKKLKLLLEKEAQKEALGLIGKRSSKRSSQVISLKRELIDKRYFMISIELYKKIGLFVTKRKFKLDRKFSENLDQISDSKKLKYVSNRYVKKNFFS